MATLVALLYFATPARSAACVPANTCFVGQGGNSPSAFDNSYMMTCDSGVATKVLYQGCNDCSCTESSSTATGVHDGDKVAGSASGAIGLDYLQGTGCPTLTSDFADCTEYMVIRHRGDSNYDYAGEDLPYQDIGDNCTNYIGHESTFTQFDEVAIPVGCVNTEFSGGSILYHCDESEWGYTYYDAQGCTGNVLTAQTDSFAVDRCDYFNEYTHCQNSGQTTGCDNSGVQQEFWSWYDLVCCPNVAGRECQPGSSGTPSGNSNTPSPTPAPVGGGNNNTPEPTPSPVGGGNSNNTPAPTPSPVSGNSPADTPTDAPVRPPTGPGLQGMYMKAKNPVDESGVDRMSVRMAMITMAAVSCVL